MSRQHRDWDEDDVRVRPTRGTRPRSKVRPDVTKAIPATVIAVDRGRFTCLAGDNEVLAVRARHLGRKGLVVGDRVGIDGPLPGQRRHVGADRLPGEAPPNCDGPRMTPTPPNA